MVKVLFVCLGNICRSPLAEGVMRRRLAEHGRTDVTVDSAATSDWHIDSAPDPRAMDAARRRGMDIGGLRGRQLTPEDFETFDYILVMDAQNLANAQAIQSEGCRARLALLLDYAPSLGRREVPDPYWGGDDHFEAVIDMIETAVDGFLAQLSPEEPAS